VAVLGKIGGLIANVVPKVWGFQVLSNIRWRVCFYD
jgi:hypothetical protein